MYEAVKDNQPLVAEDRIIEPETSLVEFSTSAVAVMEDVGTLQVILLRSHWSRPNDVLLLLSSSGFLFLGFYRSSGNNSKLAEESWSSGRLTTSRNCQALTSS